MTAEIPHSQEGFYQPSQTFAEARIRLDGLSRKSPATITNQELFEGIADTHTALASMAVIFGVEGLDGLLAAEQVQYFDLDSPSGVMGIGFFLHNNIQTSYLAFPSNLTFNFHRDAYGQINTVRTFFDIEDEDAVSSAALDDSERRRVVEELMGCLDFRNKPQVLKRTED